MGHHDPFLVSNDLMFKGHDDSKKVLCFLLGPHVGLHMCPFWDFWLKNRAAASPTSPASPALLGGLLALIWAEVFFLMRAGLRFV